MSIGLSYWEPVRKIYFFNFSSKIYARNHSRQENMVDLEQVHAIAKKNHYSGNLLTFICSTSHILETAALFPQNFPSVAQSPRDTPPHQPMFTWQKHTILVNQTLFPGILTRDTGSWRQLQPSHPVLVSCESCHQRTQPWSMASYNESLSIDLVLVIPEARLLNCSFSFLPVNPYFSLNVGFYCFQPKPLTIILHAYFSVNHSLFSEHLPYFGIILVVLGFVFIELTHGHKIQVIKQNTKQNAHVSWELTSLTGWSLYYVKFSQNWIMLY